MSTTSAATLSNASHNYVSALYPEPVGGASLLLAFRPVSRTFLVFGINRLAAVRVLMALEAGASVIVASHRPLDMACDELQWRICQRKQARYVHLPASDIDENYRAAVCGLLDEFEDATLACVTDTLLLTEPIENHREERERAKVIYNACRARRIPINVTDTPELCDFTFPSTHRFNSSAPSPTSSGRAQASPPLQIAVTTNGQGCRLAGRVRREISTKLHPKLGDAVANIVRLRAIAKNYHRDAVATNGDGGNRDSIFKDIGEDEAASAPLNSPVPQIGVGEDPKQVEERDPTERVARRMRWVNQISEYWPVERLAALREDEMQIMLELGTGGGGATQAGPDCMETTLNARTSHTSGERNIHSPILGVKFTQLPYTLGWPADTHCALFKTKI